MCDTFFSECREERDDASEHGAQIHFFKVLLQGSQYTDDTQSLSSFVFLTAIYRALRRDRCLVITT
jgi:hypothetical protein